MVHVCEEMRWILITILFKSVVTQNTHYDCFGAGLMDGNCSSTQKIYPLDVVVGTKHRSLNCSMEYTRDLNWTTTQFDMCCKPEPGDNCVGKYINVGNPLSTFIFYEYCIGRSTCLVLQVPRVDTAYLSCDQTQYYAQTTFMAMEYECIEESKIGTVNTAVNKQSDPGESVYLKGESYETPLLGVLASVSTQSCSVEASSCESIISIDVLDLRLANGGDTCNQSIIIVDGDRTTTLDCSSNINFTSYSVQSRSSYLNVTFVNSLSSNGGHFWFGFRTDRPETVRLECPAKAPQNECITTTTDTTTTTELTTTSTESVTTSTEPATTSSQSDTTTSESDTTTSESDTTSIERNTSSTFSVTTSATTGQEVPKSVDKMIIIVVVVVVVIVVVLMVVIIAWRRNYKVGPETSTGENENENTTENNTNDTNTLDVEAQQISGTDPDRCTNGNDVASNHDVNAPVGNNVSKNKKKKERKKKKKGTRKHEQKGTNMTNDHEITPLKERLDQSNFDREAVDPSSEDQRMNSTYLYNAVTFMDDESKSRHKKKKKRRQAEPRNEIEMAIEGNSELQVEHQNDNEEKSRTDVLEENTDVKKKKKKKKKSAVDMTNDEDMNGETHKKSKKKKKHRDRRETNDTESNLIQTETLQ